MIGNQKFLGAKEYFIRSYSMGCEMTKEFIDKIYLISQLVVEIQEELQDMAIKFEIKVL